MKPRYQVTLTKQDRQELEALKTRRTSSYLDLHRYCGIIQDNYDNSSAMTLYMPLGSISPITETLIVRG